MANTEYQASPGEVRAFVLAQTILTAVLMVVLFWALGGLDADLPPWWLIGLLVGMVVGTGVLAERVWLSIEPLDPAGEPQEIREQAVAVFAGHLVHKVYCCEIAVVVAAVVALATDHGAWPLVFGGVPALLLLAYETWPGLRNTSMTEVMLDADGASSELVTSFHA